jgi:hypothetical protein
VNRAPDYSTGWLAFKQTFNNIKGYFRPHNCILHDK